MIVKKEETSYSVIRSGEQNQKEAIKLELSNQIKKYRTNMKLSQEELGEKVYVTRQTISNWETGKNYPDIHSLLLLSSVFGVSLDQLIKGDIDIMKEEMKAEDIKKLNYYGNIYTILLILCVVSAVPLAVFLGIYGLIIFLLLFAVTLFFAVKVEKCKKENDVQTYKEIIAFMNGERLDEITKHREYGKRPYQKFLLAIGAGLITLAILALMGMLFKIF